MRGRDEEPSRRESAAAAEELGDRAGFGWHDERGQRGRTRDGEEGDVVVAHVGIFGERAAGNREKETVDVVGERAAGSREKERATATVLMRIETAKMRWRFFFCFYFLPFAFVDESREHFVFLWSHQLTVVHMLRCMPWCPSLWDFF
jgi:hypothetical protein